MSYVAGIRGQADYPELVKFLTNLRNNPISCLYGQANNPVRYYPHVSNHVFKIEENSNGTHHDIKDVKLPSGAWLIGP
jgi:hypothetical protein